MMTTARAAAATHHQSSGRPSAESTSVAAATGRSSGCGRGAAVDRRGAAVDRQRRSDAGVYEVCASLARSRVSRVRSPQRKRRVERVSRSRHTEANRRVPEKLLEKLLETVLEKLLEAIRDHSRRLKWSRTVSNGLEKLLEKFLQKASHQKTSLFRFRFAEHSAWQIRTSPFDSWKTLGTLESPWESSRSFFGGHWNPYYVY